MNKIFNKRNKVVSIEDLIENFLMDLDETKELKISAREFYNIIKEDRFIDEEFALMHSTIYSRSKGKQYIKLDCNNKPSIIDGIFLNEDDLEKLEIFKIMKLQRMSLDDIKDRIPDIDDCISRCKSLKKAKIQIASYNLIMEYKELLNKKIKSIKDLYLLLNS